MRRILFLTNYASPYRVRFFDELGTYADVTVLFSERIEDKKHRDASWFVQGNGSAKYIQLQKRRASFRGKDLCTDVIDWLKKPFDAIVLCGYSSPTTMLAMAWLRMRKIPFWLEVDGGLIRDDSPVKFRYKRFLVSRASCWLSSGRYTTDYLVHYGADRQRVFTYPFSSLQTADLLTECVTQEEKAALRRELEIPEEKVILSIGQMIHRKGIDVLLKSAAKMPRDIGIYIVGGEPTEEYLALQQEYQLDNVHFLGFRQKAELLRYYKAADLFALPTREDIWGLVVNEAMACGLGVVTTDRCVAGLELVEDGVNGFIVPAGDENALARKLTEALSGDPAAMGRASLNKIRPYTIENMAKVHAEILN